MNGRNWCQRCQDIKILRNLPHCCGCSCEYYARREMCDRENGQWRNYRLQHLRPSSCRRTDHGQFSDRNNNFQIYGSKDYPGQRKPDYSYCCTCGHQPTCLQQKYKPFKPRCMPKGPISVYRADFLPPVCSGPRCLDDRDPMCRRPPWNSSTKDPCYPYDCTTIAATEAKLKVLDDLLYQCDGYHPAVPRRRSTKDEDLTPIFDKKGD